ncbi:hypothetical protein AAFM49_21355 [Burkholderia pseudomallei]|uniref:hypothetical protein n=1 Tax=Burkholderia pseudomallei TaxID=28450 RepID=UPI00313EBE70
MTLKLSANNIKCNNDCKSGVRIIEIHSAMAFDIFIPALRVFFAVCNDPIGKAAGRGQIDTAIGILNRCCDAIGKFISFSSEPIFCADRE